MTTAEMLRLAVEQSAEDIGCQAEDFERNQNVIVSLRIGQNARKYVKQPLPAVFVSYGCNVVAAASEDLIEPISEYASRYTFYHLFETPALYWLNERIAPSGYGVCLMAEYFLPCTEHLSVLPCNYVLRVLGPLDFQELYLPQWSNALCRDRRDLDVLGVGAYDGDVLVGLAACSADCENMWQIGVDVLPAYRRKGIASALTTRLAQEILSRGKVPFYCCAWSNIRSSRVALRSGFAPAWVEMTVRPMDAILEMNAQRTDGDIPSGTIQQS
ncbi:MAG: GNAT family N-acetyltransferase [Clostridia bacterium]|nr:GNAT family N-acetyltransferase [Clostridia bacterium]